MIEAECPLCNTVYLLNRGEIQLQRGDEAYIKGNRLYDIKGVFHCPECDRDVIADDLYISMWKETPDEIDTLREFAYRR